MPFEGGNELELLSLLQFHHVNTAAVVPNKREVADSVESKTQAPSTRYIAPQPSTRLSCQRSGSVTSIPF